MSEKTPNFCLLLKNQMRGKSGPATQKQELPQAGVHPLPSDLPVDMGVCLPSCCLVTSEPSPLPTGSIHLINLPMCRITVVFVHLGEKSWLRESGL